MPPSVTKRHDVDKKNDAMIHKVQLEFTESSYMSVTMLPMSVFDLL